jgi:hypothetical protein
MNQPPSAHQGPPCAQLEALSIAERAPLPPSTMAAAESWERSFGEQEETEQQAFVWASLARCERRASAYPFALALVLNSEFQSRTSVTERWGSGWQRD